MFTDINQSSEKAQFCIHLISRSNAGCEASEIQAKQLQTATVYMKLIP